jgi:hypothetical protein
VIQDLETGAKLAISRYALDKAYKADRANGKRQKKYRLNFEKRNAGATL